MPSINVVKDGLMRCVDYGTGGDANCLRLIQVPRPVPKGHEVQIKVAYAGVNRPDILQRSGSYPPPLNASPFLGLEVSGIIEEVGSLVTEWKVGEVVCALTPGGGYAEYVTVPSKHCLPIPKGLSLIEACALPENYFTVWTNVIERGKLSNSDSILIHGGSSGIGLTAIQLAKQFGARVYTTVSNSEKADACYRAGADVVINYRSQDFVKEIQTETNGHGVDLILDIVGAPYFQRNIDSLAIEGRLIQIAFLEGSEGLFDMKNIMMKRLTFTGSTLRAQSDVQKGKLRRALQNNIWPLLEKGNCKPVIYKCFDFTEVSQAHILMESSQHIGKIVLEVNP